MARSLKGWAALALAVAIGFAAAVVLTMPGTPGEGYEGQIEIREVHNNATEPATITVETVSSADTPGTGGSEQTVDRWEVTLDGNTSHEDTVKLDCSTGDEVADTIRFRGDFAGPEDSYGTHRSVLAEDCGHASTTWYRVVLVHGAIIPEKYD